MNQVVEINEAINAGQDLLKEIDYALSKISDASFWGFIDMFSDSGLLTSIFKHSNLHKAQDSKDRLVYLINRFNDELDDIKVNSNIENIAMSRGIEFCDFFFDGIIVDVYTLSKIRESKNQLNELKRKVQLVLDDLNKIK